MRRKPCDYNLVVIGAGSAGLVTAYLAAATRARVALVERDRMGGECLNTGCVPSKALIRSARFLYDTARSAEFGVRKATVEFDFADIMERVQRSIRSVAPHDSVERYRGLGVDCIAGEACVRSPHEVVVDDRVLTTRRIVIATGSSPVIPDIPGIGQVDVLTSDNIWGLRQLPGRLLVLGGGPIGCELAQCFARFGSRVSILHRRPYLLPREDADISALVMERLGSEGIDLRLGQEPVEVRVRDGSKIMVCEGDGDRREIEFDALLVAAGRTPNTRGLGLEALGMPMARDGGIAVDARLQTGIRGVFACGDVVGPYRFTHMAAHQAWYATVNALFGRLWKFRVDYSVVPWCTFTDPEVATVGLNERQAREQGIAYELTTFGIEELDRAIVDGEARGMVKVLTVPGRDRVLGASIAGPHAGELIAEYVTAMRHRLGLKKILGTTHVYPTFMEANKHAAGAWRQAHVPALAGKLLGHFHRWMR